MVIEELVKTVLCELKEISKTQTVIGDPIALKDVTVIPVSKVSLGFGIGGGEGSDKPKSYEGTGGGIAIEPVAFIVVRKETVELITLSKTGSVLGDVMELVPKVMDRVKEWKGKKPRASKADGEAA
jgi:uncharacterized spore protein YtfJ